MTRNIPNVFGLPAEMIEKQGDKALRISTDLAFRALLSDGPSLNSNEMSHFRYIVTRADCMSQL